MSGTVPLGGRSRLSHSTSRRQCHCAATVTKTAKLVDPEAKVDVDLETKKVKIESGEEREQFAQALTEAGYPPAP